MGSCRGLVRPASTINLAFRHFGKYAVLQTSSMVLCMRQGLMARLDGATKQVKSDAGRTCACSRPMLGQ